MSADRPVPSETRPYALVDCDVHPLMGEGMLRGDADSPEGAAPGVDPAHTARQPLDRYGIDRAILIGGRCWAWVRCPTRTTRP